MKIHLLSTIITMLAFSLTPATVWAEESGPNDCSGCWWGKPGEKTTYTAAYCPAEAPDIPVIPSVEDRKNEKKRYPMSPNEAICVIRADGCKFCYYYREATRYRSVSEYRWVFEPMEKMESREIEETNPYTGLRETRLVTEPVQSVFPIYHEKEFVRYEPERVLVPVIIPGKVANESDVGVMENGSAAIRFSTEVSL